MLGLVEIRFEAEPCWMDTRTTRLGLCVYLKCVHYLNWEIPFKVRLGFGVLHISLV